MQRDDRVERWSFAQFVREFCMLPRGEFLREFLAPLLVQHTEPSLAAGAPLDPAPFGTMRIRTGAKAPVPHWVYSVSKAENPFKTMITVGRAPNNDVILPYEEVSKFHAFFLESPAGLMLADAQSTNGTFVNGVRLEPNKPCALGLAGGLNASGVGLTFSGVKLTLHAPGRLWDLIASTKPFAAVA